MSELRKQLVQSDDESALRSEGRTDDNCFQYGNNSLLYDNVSTLYDDLHIESLESELQFSLDLNTKLKEPAVLNALLEFLDNLVNTCACCMSE